MGWWVLCLDQIIRNLFCVDLRALGLMRIGLGCTFFGDLMIRCGTGPRGWRDWWGEDGFAPREYYWKYIYEDISMWSLHAHLDDSVTDWLLVLQFILAALFTFGIKSRLTGFLSYALHLSMNHRSPEIEEGSDNLLRILTLWAIMTPCGTCYSVENLFKRPTKSTSSPTPGTVRHKLHRMRLKVHQTFYGKKGSAYYKLRHFVPDFLLPSTTDTQETCGGYEYYGIAPFGLFMQQVMMYFTASLQKHGDVWRKTYHAIWLVNHLKQSYTRPGGALMNSLLGIKGQQWATFGVVWLEYAIIPLAILCVIPCPTRGAKIFNLLLRVEVIVLTWLLHTGFNFCLWVGNFPWISTVGCVPCLPGVVIDQFEMLCARLFYKITGKKRQGHPKWIEELGKRVLPVAALRNPTECTIRFLFDSGLPCIMKLHLVPTQNPAESYLRCRIVQFEKLEEYSVDVNSVVIEYSINGAAKQEKSTEPGNWDAETDLEMYNEVEYSINIVIKNSRTGMVLGEGLLHLIDDIEMAGNNGKPPPEVAAPSKILLHFPSKRRESSTWRFAAIVMLTYAVMFNYCSLAYPYKRFNLPIPVVKAGVVWGVEQGWGMFAPIPLAMDTWSVIVGYTVEVDRHKLSNGSVPTSIDLPPEEEVNLREWMYHGITTAPVTEERPRFPEHGVYQWPSSRWQKWWMNPNVGTSLSPRQLPYILRYLCRNWNENGEYERTGKFLSEVELIIWIEPNPLDPNEGSIPPSRDRVFLKPCPPLKTDNITHYWPKGGYVSKGSKPTHNVTEAELRELNPYLATGNKPPVKYPDQRRHTFGLHTGKSVSK